MRIIKGLRVRIYPNTEQEKLLYYYCDISHKSYNNLVAYFKNKIEQDNEFRVPVNSFGVKDFTPRDLESLLNTELYNIDCHNRIFLDVLKRYSQAWQRCYRRINNSKQPKFHKYNPKKKSFGIASQTYPIKNGMIQIPKAKSVKQQHLQDFGINIESMYIPINQEFLDKFQITEIIEPTFTYHRGKWYLSGCYYKEIEVSKSKDYLGLDWGVKNFYTDNNGNKYNYPKSVLRQFQRINSLKSKKSKKKKNSNNYKKISNKLDLAHERFANLKREFIEQTTSQLSNFNIVIEDLTNAKILKSHKQRSRLSMIAPRQMFNDRLEQKCFQKGNDFIKVDTAYTSKTCSKCGKVKENLTTKIRVFECECGLVLDRDKNASINILARGYC